MSIGARPSAGIVITANLRHVILQVVSSYLNIVITRKFKYSVCDQMTSLKTKSWFRGGASGAPLPPIFFSNMNFYYNIV